jgi:hypothetical protein
MQSIKKALIKSHRTALLMNFTIAGRQTLLTKGTNSTQTEKCNVAMRPHYFMLPCKLAAFDSVPSCFTASLFFDPM